MFDDDIGFDNLGFLFDPFDVNLEEFVDHVRRPTYSHFGELLYLRSFEWVDGCGNVVRMDHFKPMHIRYLINIVQWMERQHSAKTPYKDTLQFKYARKRIVKLQRRIDAARAILAKPMGWSKL